MTAHVRDGAPYDGIALDVLLDIPEALDAGGPLADSQRVEDLNVLIAHLLVDRYGARRVSTGWISDSEPARTVARIGERAVTFIPHRVHPAALDRVRVMLDTSVVRRLARRAPDALDVERCRVSIVGEPVVFSIADGAVLELLDDLTNGSVSFEQWAHAAPQLQALLDPTMPIGPGGRELAPWLPAIPRKHGIDSAQHRRASWEHLALVRSRADLVAARRYRQADGALIEDQLDPVAVAREVEAAGAAYAAWFAKVVHLARDERGQMRSRDWIVGQMLAGLSEDMGCFDATRLELACHYQAQRAIEAAHARTPYVPTRNDALDLELLFTLPLPAVVCTADDRLVRFVRRLHTEQGDLVMTARELVEWLDPGTDAPP